MPFFQDDILVFGGNGGREKQPEYVREDWSIATEFLKEKKGIVSSIPAFQRLPCHELNSWGPNLHISVSYEHKDFMRHDPK